MKISGFPRISREFANAIRRAQTAYPGIGNMITVKVTPDAGMTGRAFGYYDEGTQTVGLSPRLEAEPRERIQGIITHELGHVAAHLFGSLENTGMGEEKKADAIASELNGRTMRYDAWDVQTTGAGSTVRPAYLHE